jgi:chromosome segregation ATPase
MSALADDAARALALAGRALDRATEAKARADEALAGHRATYEALGGLAGEMAGLRTELVEHRAQMSIAIRELREVRKAARSSQARIDEIEDSQVTDLREKLAEANRRLAEREDKQVERRDKWFWWFLGICAALIVTAVSVALGWKK